MSQFCSNKFPQLTTKIKKKKLATFHRFKFFFAIKSIFDFEKIINSLLYNVPMIPPIFNMTTRSSSMSIDSRNKEQKGKKRKINRNSLHLGYFFLHLHESCEIKKKITQILHIILNTSLNC